MYIKEFEIRWSDVDANHHLRNSAYIDYMSHTRMSFFLDKGFGQLTLASLKLGPVALQEHMYYFKEVFPGHPVKVSMQLKGLSQDGMFFQFLHDFYDHSGHNLARCEMLGAWIDTETRKLTPLPDILLDTLNTIEKTNDFKTLVREDTWKYGQRRKDLK